MTTNKILCASLAAAALACAFPAAAQTVKIGLISSYSGPGAAQGDQIDKGVKLYMKLNADKLPPGVKVELISRDDTGANGDVAKRIAQELIVRDKVQILTGVVWTPNMAAIAPLTAEAKIPFVSANASGAKVVGMSPYMARVSFTLCQSAYPLGQWAAKKYKKAYSAVSDFAPGHEAEGCFIRGFKEGGGDVIGSVRIPLANPDFVPFMQRIKDAKPDVLFAFNPAGKQATAMMKAYGDLGMDKANIKYLGTGDITTGEAHTQRVHLDHHPSRRRVPRTVPRARPGGVDHRCPLRRAGRPVAQRRRVTSPRERGPAHLGLRRARDPPRD